MVLDKFNNLSETTLTIKSRNWEKRYSGIKNEEISNRYCRSYLL